jgi:hypothetical protein
MPLRRGESKGLEKDVQFSMLKAQSHQILGYILAKGPVRLIGQKVLSFERCFLKGETPEFATDFDHPLSCERPFKW